MKRPLTNTERTKKRRERQKAYGITELRIEVSQSEKKVIKSLSEKLGYNSMSEFIILEVLKKAKNHGVTPTAQ